MANCKCSNYVEYNRHESIERNTVEPIVLPSDPVVNQPAESNVEIPLKRSQMITLAISNDYIYLHQSDLNIGQSNDPTLLMKQYLGQIDYCTRVMQGELDL